MKILKVILLKLCCNKPALIPRENGERGGGGGGSARGLGVRVRVRVGHY